MKQISTQTKTQTKGGLSELAIFSIITAVGAGVSLITNIASGVLNAEANKKAKPVHMMNSSSQYHARTAVY